MREVINGEEGEQMKETGEGRRAEEPRLEGNVAADRRFGTGTVTGPWAGGTWGCSPHGGGRNTDTAEHNDVMVSAAESLGVLGLGSLRSGRSTRCLMIRKTALCNI